MEVGQCNGPGSATRKDFIVWVIFMTISNLQSIFFSSHYFFKTHFPAYVFVINPRNWLPYVRYHESFCSKINPKKLRMFRLGTRSILQKIKPINVGRVEPVNPVSLLTNQIRALSVTPQQERHLWLRKKKAFGQPYLKTHPRNRHYKWVFDSSQHTLNTQISEKVPLLVTFKILSGNIKTSHGDITRNRERFQEIWQEEERLRMTSTSFQGRFLSFTVYKMRSNFCIWFFAKNL